MKVSELKKKILIYAHYYVPDTASTGQILKELAEGMLEKFDVTVICVVPSYLGVIEGKYKTQRFYEENINGVRVLRIRVPEFSKTDKKSRIINILSYFFGAMKATNMLGKQDYVFSISQPPILGGVLGVYGKYKKKSKFIYNIQDFNPEQIMAISYSSNKLVLKTMMWLDKRSCKKSDKIIVVGRDMIETLKNRFSEKIPKNCFINNWIDEKEMYPLDKDDSKVIEFKTKHGLENKFVIMYSGNIGLYYDLKNIIKVIAKFNKDDRVVFAFVGDGSVKDDLVRYSKENNLKNVIFIPYQKKKDLIYSLNAADVHWCVNAKGIKGVSVPSKVYGIMAVGKPVLGVLEENSEARLLIESAECGLCCDPGDYEEIYNMICHFIDEKNMDSINSMGKNGRKYLVNNLTRDVSIRKYIDEIMSC